MAKMELPEQQKTKQELEDELKAALIPKDPSDDKNVILEIRAGTGGEEAALFGGSLLRMYTRYAERHNFKTEATVFQHDRTRGRKRNDTADFAGRGAYARLEV